MRVPEREVYMLIREANINDAMAIARVQVDTWRTTYAGIVPAAYLTSLSYEHQGQVWGHLVSTMSDTAGMYVVETPARVVVGFAHGGPERSDSGDYRGELYALYLLAAYQRQGLGRQLTGAVVNRLLHHGLSSMLVWVLAANPYGAFYEALGGQYVREQEITISGAQLNEVAYGWLDLKELAERIAGQTR
jgi:GNAT superfamily N-acetyltransferase